MKNLAWHFTGTKLRDGQAIPPIGKKLVFKGKPILCEQGLHFSLHPFDALQYSPGPFLHRVSYGGEVEIGDDKGVCTERTIVASIDATELLRELACNEALRVLPANAPDIVRRYLTTRDENLRNAAWDAAWDAARGAAWGAVQSAARYAAWDAARGAALGAAQSVAWDAAWGAARGAAQSVAWDAAWRAAWSAARKRQAATFLAMCEKAFKL